jgi:hypothetical protein
MLMPLHSRTILTCKLGRLVWVYSSLIRRSIHPNPSTSRQDSWHALQCSWLRFAATVIHSLQIRECSFLSDCEQLVHFINSSDHSNPPDRRIKPYTPVYDNLSNIISSGLLKVIRNNNTTADALARQAQGNQAPTLETMCTHQHGCDHCFVSQVLHSVDLPDVFILAARCC